MDEDGLRRGVAVFFAALTWGAADVSAQTASTGSGQAASTGSGQAWPAKPVRVIVPFEPGGGTDIQARLIGRKFYDSFGQTFITENRAGAGGMIGAEAVAKAAPDGYTLLFTSASLAVNVSLYKRAVVDPLRDFAPVSWVSSTPLVLVVHPSTPAKNVRELVALAKRRAGELNAASNGSGTTSHLSIEMLKQLAGVQITHVPYKGGAPSTTAVVSGEVGLAFPPILSAQPFIKSGKVRPLAVTTAKRSSAYPELPAIAETVAGFETNNWYAFFAPAGTPQDIIAKLQAETVKALKAADVGEYMKRDGADPVGSTPSELAAYFRREVAKYAQLIKAANIQVE